MKAANMVEQLERSIVTQTAGLLRGRLPEGRVYQRRLRREWEQQLKRRAS
ncbi:MAG: hypothetical protein Q8R91_06960 [Candidatus Omnitrophota bacterium]|nr:hypothetical protein [Candidatus Omnitrophota bacterium]